MIWKRAAILANENWHCVNLTREQTDTHRAQICTLYNTAWCCMFWLLPSMTFNDYNTLYLCMFTCCSNTTDNDDDVEYVRIPLDKTKNIIINRSIYEEKYKYVCVWICDMFEIFNRIFARFVCSFAYTCSRSFTCVFLLLFFFFRLPLLFARLHPFVITLRITLDGGLIVFRLHLSQCHIHVPLHVSTVCCDHFGVSRWCSCCCHLRRRRRRRHHVWVWARNALNGIRCALIQSSCRLYGWMDMKCTGDVCIFWICLSDWKTFK